MVSFDRDMNNARLHRCGLYSAALWLCARLDFQPTSFRSAVSSRSTACPPGPSLRRLNGPAQFLPGRLHAQSKTTSSTREGSYLVPTLGPRRLDAITNEQVQRLKLALSERAPRTVNNVLAVLSTLLKKTVEWASSSDCRA